jgi:hypothetical protein
MRQVGKKELVPKADAMREKLKFQTTSYRYYIKNNFNTSLAQT